MTQSSKHDPIIVKVIRQYVKDGGRKSPSPSRSYREKIEGLRYEIVRLNGSRGAHIATYEFTPSLSRISPALVGRPALKKRGWSERMIDSFLRDPDEWAMNPYFRSGPKIALYHLDRVERVEEEPRFVERLAAATVRSEAMQRPVEPLEATAANVAKALWTINKAAKRRRDSGENAYHGGRHGLASYHSTEKRRFYEVKTRVIQRAIELGWAESVGVHRLVLRREQKESFLACYQICGFRFHQPLNEPGKDEPTDLPEGWTGKAAPAGSEMSDRKAMATLESFLAQEGAEEKHPDAMVSGSSV